MATTATATTVTPTVIAPQPVLLPGTKTLLLGGPGSGKTTSLTTFIEAGLELFVTITDPNGEEALLDAMERRKLPLNKLHWRYISAASPSWDTLYNMAQKIQLMSYEDLTKIKSGVEKDKHQQFMQVVEHFANFKCDRTGEKYGPIDKWGTDRAFALDSLSGLNTMALDLMVGAKPIAHMGEYGVAMNAEEKLIRKLVADLKCFVVITAHLDRTLDEITNRPKLMVAALGSKLAPKLSKDFSDVVVTYRDGDKFFWSTTAPDIDLKARTLPLKDRLEPSFCQVVESWRKRVKMAEQKQQPQT